MYFKEKIKEPEDYVKSLHKSCLQVAPKYAEAGQGIISIIPRMMAFS